MRFAVSILRGELSSVSQLIREFLFGIPISFVKYQKNNTMCNITTVVAKMRIVWCNWLLTRFQLPRHSPPPPPAYPYPLSSTKKTTQCALHVGSPTK